MPHRHQGEERRVLHRREDDEAQAEIVERAVHDAPIVNSLLKTGRVAVAMMAVGTLLGAAGGAMGMRITGPKDDGARVSARIDSNAARIAHVVARGDSLVQVLTEMRHTLEQIAYIQCVQLRRTDSDLRPQGCDEAVAKHAAP